KVGVEVIPVLQELSTIMTDLATGPVDALVDAAMRQIQLKLKVVRVVGATIKSIWQEILASFKFTGDELRKESDRIAKEYTDKVKEILGVKPPDVKTREVQIGAPGPVIPERKRQFYDAQVEEHGRIEVGGLAEGWRIGLNKYINDNGSMLGLAVDLSRRTAQLMETGFRTFFFDVMEGPVKSFKDLLNSVLDFVKQIVAQVAAQCATVRILKGLAAIPFFAPTPAPVDVPGGCQHWGRWTVRGPGGPDSRLQAFMASPGERITVETPEQQRRGQPVTVQVQVTNNTPSQV